MSAQVHDRELRGTAAKRSRDKLLLSLHLRVVKDGRDGFAVEL